MTDQHEPQPDEKTAELAAPETDDGPTGRLSVDPSDDSPDPVTPGAGAPGVPEGDPPEAGETATAARPATPAKPAPCRRFSSAGALIWVLLALFGFTLVVQLRSNDGDQGLAGARQEDLVRILSDLEARDSRLQSEINALETSQRQLTSGVA